MTDKWLIRRFVIGRRSARPSQGRRLSARAVFGTLLSFLTTYFPAHLAYGAPVEIGELTPFYRSMQMQGHIPGHGLIEIPAYLTAPDIDIRYRKIQIYKRRFHL